MPHFHHFSICNQNQSISILVIFGQNTKAIALLFGQKCLTITFQLQSKSSISILIIFGQSAYPYFLAKMPHFHHFSICNQSINFNFGHFWPKYQGYSLTFWPKMPYCDHFSICNQNQSISILVIFGQNTKAIALLLWPKMPHFDHLSIAKNQFSILVNFGQYQGYSLMANMPHFHQICNQNLNFNFGHFWPKYQGYSLTFWPKMPHFHHFSICNQNQSISILVIFGQNTQAIALLFGQKCLIFITFQSAIKINQFQFWSFLAKIPSL